MADLTTLARVKEYAGIAGTTYDAQVQNHLTAASRFIERWCDRVFHAADYVEYHDGGAGPWARPFVQTHQYPVLSLSRVAGRLDWVVRVTNSSASVQRAVVSFDGTTLTLTRTADGASAADALTLADYATFTALADAVNDLGNGWAATTSAYGDWPANLLVPDQWGEAKGQGGVALCFHVETGCPRYERETGMVYGPFPRGWKNVEVRYRAGYETIPDDVQMGCAALAAAMFGRTQSAGGSAGGGVKAERVGDYAVEYFDATAALTTNQQLAALAPDAYALLLPYKRLPV